MITETQRLLLQILAAELFGREKPSFDGADWASLVKEAEQQTVFPLVLPAIETQLPEALVPNCQRLNLTYFRAAIRNAHQHGEVHDTFSGGGIPYVIIKGMASASYYPDPFRRTMGDVDVLIDKTDIAAASALLKNAGYVTNELSDHPAHLAFHKGSSVIEVHWEPNGLPDGEKGELCRKFLEDTISTGIEYATQNERFLIPDEFHHGLVMLLHTAKHIINTGIGLRHLCDWAVFAGKLEDDRFRALFEKKLKAVGLWRFAQLLTQVSVRYLGCPEKAWAADDTDEALLEAMIADVFDAGNFGHKDVERLNEAKLMTAGNSGTVDGSKGVVFKSLTQKAYKAMPACKKAKILLPIGWTVAGVKHLRLVRKGRRPKIHVSKMIAGAEKRRNIYMQFKLYQ